MARSGAETSFRFEGQQHQIRLLGVTGRSARVLFSSDPTEAVLSVTQAELVDLTGDTVPDATATLVGVSAEQAVVQLVPLPNATWDETGFQSAGGLRPWDVDPANGTVFPALVSDGRGQLVLFSVSASRRVAWQRFRPDGTFLAVPTFGAGLLDREVSERYAVHGLDAVAVPGGFVVATELIVSGGYATKGIALVPYGANLRPTGPPLLVDGLRPRLAYDGGRLWLAATDGHRVTVSEITTGTTLAVKRSFRPSTPPAGRSDGLPGLAVDRSTGDLVLVWGRSGPSGSGELRLAAVDPTTGTVLREVQVSATFVTGATTPHLDAPDVLALAGPATVEWRYGTGREHVYTATVDLASGLVSHRTDQLWSDVTGGPTLEGQAVLGQLGGKVYLVGLQHAAQPSGAPSQTYRVAVVKRGYTAVPDRQVRVAFDQTRVESVSLAEAHAATATGKVVDEHGAPVAGASVEVVDLGAADRVVQSVTSAADGTFGPLSLPAETTRAHSYVLRGMKTGIASTATDQVNVYGGDVTSSLLALVPSASGELHGVAADEGYTSWMVKASFPGFAVLPAADMYVWMGNYAVKVSSEFWDGTHELVGVDVSVQGASYESHATKSEIDFTAMQGSDFNDLFTTTSVADESGKLDLGGFFLDVVKEHATDLISVVGNIKDLFDPGDAVETGQGSQLLTWKEGKEDFRVIPEFDSSAPVSSVFDIVTSLPTGFAIPVVIGGSSEELSSVRVDQVDVVDASTYQVLWSSEPSRTSVPHEWFSWQGPDGPAGVSSRHYAVTRDGVDERNVLIEVFLNIGKVRPSAVGGGNPDVFGTSFAQREQQVVIFRPATSAMVALIAPGDLYRDGTRVRPTR